ncbi:hypothetical protein C8Q80DRAFT_1273749 [Daedaleopsis nitida]|nr:hypothetical protein C8Q80DRAFT_1273749 [Daedaleopsis nitida]
MRALLHKDTRRNLVLLPPYIVLLVGYRISLILCWYIFVIMVNKNKSKEKPMKKTGSGRIHRHNSPITTRPGNLVAEKQISQASPNKSRIPKEEKLRSGVAFRAYKCGQGLRKNPAPQVPSTAIISPSQVDVAQTPTGSQSGGWFPPVTPASLASEPNSVCDYSDWNNMFKRIDKAGGHVQDRSHNDSSTSYYEVVPTMPAPSSSTVPRSLSYPEPVGGVGHVNDSGWSSSLFPAVVSQEHPPPLSSGAVALYVDSRGRVAIPGSSGSAATDVSWHGGGTTSSPSGSSLTYPGTPASAATTVYIGMGTAPSSMVDGYQTSLAIAYRYPSAPHGMNATWQDRHPDVLWDYRQPSSQVQRMSREQDLHVYPPSPVPTTHNDTPEDPTAGFMESNAFADLAFDVHVPGESCSDTSVIDPGEDTRSLQSSSIDSPLSAWLENLVNHYVAPPRAMEAFTTGRASGYNFTDTN